MSLLGVYLAGLIATAVTSLGADRGATEHQRNPCSCHLLLAVAWPLFVGFLAYGVLSALRLGEPR